ncbi:MAG: maltose phosphorylase [Gammaproteobacteria bacterium GWE2_37_16]|nr:MAG: maltose phosphorylase [Gammaproteobacteria bacterium GWE2_37_16]
MNKYLTLHPWHIIEEGFNGANQKSSESLFSIGNGRMGQRASFEESYSGETLLGNYIGGVYYPDPTKVGYWKHGYPAYFAKLVNTTSWIGIDIQIGKEKLDLAKCKVHDFLRTLNMQEGYLERSFIAEFPSGKQVKVHSKRFLSIVDREIGAVRYAITPLNFSSEIAITPYLDSNMKNDWANYGDRFSDPYYREAHKGEAYLTIETCKTNFHVCTGMKFAVVQNDKQVVINPELIAHETYVANTVKVQCLEGEETVIYKYAAILASLYYAKEELLETCAKLLHQAFHKGFESLLAEQAAAWIVKWEHSDVTIEGDVAAQQAIRFNIFQLNQTYTGQDPELNIGPKGYTGEKYGGVTYWDTEAYCLPFYLATSGEEAAKSLLLYRYKHLPKAIENAENIGLYGRAALYPMVTVNGEECHNEWEITFEEIHRNGAMAYAIYNYVRYTGDKNYLVEYGLEVLIALARFWQKRASFSTVKNKYVILGVTGPNEYENNVDNNWYTNILASWTLDYTQEVISYVKQVNPEKFHQIATKTKLQENDEILLWRKVRENMYFPKDEKLGIFLQQDNYLDKEQRLAKELDPSERPLNQHWSWDRILRSCFIKQADVLQGIYFFEENYDLETIKRNFDFYEPRTVHESSLSPCVHAILAAKLGYEDKAYEMYLRTARLDLDDYNHEVKEGCHITSMAGSWLAIVQGFGGMRVRNNELHFKPMIIPNWQFYAFKIIFRDNLLNIKVSKECVEIANESTAPIGVWVYDKRYLVEGKGLVNIM